MSITGHLLFSFCPSLRNHCADFFSTIGIGTGTGTDSIGKIEESAIRISSSISTGDYYLPGIQPTEGYAFDI